MNFNSYIFILVFLPLTVAGYYILGKRKAVYANIWLICASFIFYAYASVSYLLLLFVSMVVNYGLSIWIKKSCTSVCRKQNSENNKSLFDDFKINNHVRKDKNVPFSKKQSKYKELSSNGKCSIIISAKTILIFGLIFNIGLLFYFKYYDFFIDSINSVFKTDMPLLNLSLPLGISFYTFGQIAYLVDVYRGEIVDSSIIDYALFTSFFPKITQGPICLYGDMVKKFHKDGNMKNYYSESDTHRGRSSEDYDITCKSNKVENKDIVGNSNKGENFKVNYESMTRGIIMFVLGLFKKVMIADSLGSAVTSGFALVNFGDIASGITSTTTITSADVFLVMLCYTFQIYFDFSGYCDMASGISLMLGIELPINFDSPYKALTITDFWKRWHISLTSFLRKYLYFPLGGNRKGTVRTYVNMMIVFLVSGLWHGANWTFVVWGLMHGAFQVLHRMTRNVFDKLPAIIKYVITFAFVNIAWLLFRADSIGEWAFMVKKAFSFSNMTFTSSIIENFKIPKMRSVLEILGVSYTDDAVYLIGTALMTIFCFVLCLVPQNNQRRDFELNKKTLVIVLFMLIICVLNLSNVSSFLYYNF